jgi:hypothetical protein
MHERYAGEGLVCMSVSIDPPEDKASALAFLTRQKAAFANYLLEEEAELWQGKWKIKAPPAVFVFDRQGRRAGKFDSDDPDKDFTYNDVDKLVQGLLKESP